VHTPLEQAYGHALGVLHVPLASQVINPLPEHCVDPGVQLPTQAPDAHAWLVHGIAGVHSPVTSQVCTASPEHRTAPGVQTPVHVPSEHA
jgi:hypothetical protein